MPLSFAAADVRGPDAAGALRRYFEELAARFPEGYDVSWAEDDARSLFSPPQGELVLAWLDGRVVGCGGLHLLDETTAEVRRMWVEPDARGGGVARALLAHLEERAVAAGCDVVVLDTHRALVEAQALYRSAGYEPIAAYNDNPSAHLWFTKRLAC